MQTPKTFSLPVTPAAWNYIRQVLGTRPYDEVGPLIAALEQSAAEQDRQAEQPAPATPPDIARMLGNGGANPLKGNGSGIADAATPQDQE